MAAHLSNNTTVCWQTPGGVLIANTFSKGQAMQGARQPKTLSTLVLIC
jgi:hypothetical protein